MKLTHFLNQRRPITPSEREKGQKVIAEIEEIKDLLMPHDNTALDSDRKKGSLEILAKPLPGFDGIVMGDMSYDSYQPEKPLRSVQVSISNNPKSSEGTFVVDDKTLWFQAFQDRDEQGTPETTIYHKHDRSNKLLQSVYIDFETGEMAYREESR